MKNLRKIFSLLYFLVGLVLLYIFSKLWFYQIIITAELFALGAILLTENHKRIKIGYWISIIFVVLYLISIPPLILYIYPYFTSPAIYGGGLGPGLAFIFFAIPLLYNLPAFILNVIAAFYFTKKLKK